MTVYLLFMFITSDTTRVLGVYDSAAGCQRAALFIDRHEVAHANLACSPWVIQK